MTQETTLFSHYKRMINSMWDVEVRKYTANELNTFVGTHEKTTSWKRMNNNPYYTTRTYQTALKQLGCITKIKRGLWQINGPIPEWFGSFHIKGLKGGFDPNNKYADHGCIYWKSLPDAHRVNPWKGVIDAWGNAQAGGMSVKLQSLLNTVKLDENQQRRDELNATLAAVKEQINQARLEDVIDASTGLYEPKTEYRDVILDPGMISTTVRFRATTSFGQELACVSWVNLFAAKDNTWDGEVSDTEITLVSNPHAEYKDILNVLNTLQGVEATKAFLMSLDKLALSEALKAYPAVPSIYGKPEEPKALEAVGAKTYTLAEVEKILAAYTEFITDDLESTVDNALSNVDADDVVELDWDRYGKTMDVSLDTSILCSRVSSDVEDNIRQCNDIFNITEVELL